VIGAWCTAPKAPIVVVVFVAVSGSAAKRLNAPLTPNFTAKIQQKYDSFCELIKNTSG